MSDYLDSADPGTPADAQQAMAVLDLRAALVAIAKLDPSNTGSTGGAGMDDQARYSARNVLVVQALAYAMAAGLPCGFAPSDDTAWPVVFIDLPTGLQVSWHLPAYPGQYNGHTTAEKYAAIREFDHVLREPRRA